MGSGCFTCVFALFEPAALMEPLRYIVTYWLNRIISWMFLHELHKTLSLAIADSQSFSCCFWTGGSAVSVWIMIQSVHFDSWGQKSRTASFVFDATLDQVLLMFYSQILMGAALKVNLPTLGSIKFILSHQTKRKWTNGQNVNSCSWWSDVTKVRELQAAYE